MIQNNKKKSPRGLYSLQNGHVISQELAWPSVSMIPKRQIDNIYIVNLGSVRLVYLCLYWSIYYSNKFIRINSPKHNILESESATG